MQSVDTRARSWEACAAPGRRGRWAEEKIKVCFTRALFMLAPTASPFLQAALNGNVAALEQLIAQGADVHEQDEYEQSAMHFGKLPPRVSASHLCLQPQLAVSFASLRYYWLVGYPRTPKIRFATTLLMLIDRVLILHCGVVLLSSYGLSTRFAHH